MSSDFFRKELGSCKAVSSKKKREAVVSVAIAFLLSISCVFLSACSSSSSSKNSSNTSSSTTSSVQSNTSSNSKSSIPAGAIEWKEAEKYIGETVTVYGPVKATKYASSSNGSPTFIDLGAAYPSSSRVTMTIWGKNRSAFSPSPEKMYSGKTVCVTGEIYVYRGVCNIEVTSPSQVKIIDK